MASAPVDIEVEDGCRPGVAVVVRRWLPGGDRPPLISRANLRTLLAGNGLLGRFGYLVISQVVVLLFGLGYWALTARMISASQVGVAAAAVSAGTLLATLGVLGIGSLLLVELGTTDKSEQRVVVTTGVMMAAAVVTVLALGTWAISSLLGESLRLIGDHPVEAGLFVVGTAATTVGGVLDSAAIGMRNGPAQLVRNSIAAALRLGFIVAGIAVGMRSTTGLLIAWVTALLISIAASPLVLRLPAGPPGAGSLRHRKALVERLWGLALRHHVLNLAITSVTFFLPVIAAVLVASDQMAYFSVAQLVASSTLLLPALLAMSLFAETTGDEELLRRHIRRTLPIGFACCLLVLVVCEPGAPMILRVFGPNYSAHGTLVLRLLLLGGLPYVIKDHYVSIRRAQRRLTEAARVVAVSTVFEATGALIGGALWGLTGVCAGWALATLVEGVVFAPAVIGLLRSGPRPSPAEQPIAMEQQAAV
jgi:O-antigen/teichoic acid export membrane protein